MNDFSKWTPNIHCHVYIDGDVVSDFLECHKKGRCVKDGKDCDFFMGIKTTEGSKGCCGLKLEKAIDNPPDRRLCFAPNRISTAVFAPSANLGKECDEFERFLIEKGWRRFVQIGRFDEQQKIFDFKLNILQLGVFNAMLIAKYFLEKGFRLDEDFSEQGAVELLKQEEQLLKL